MEPGDHDAKHPYPEQSSAGRPYDSRAFTHQQVAHGASHLTLPPPNQQIQPPPRQTSYASTRPVPVAGLTRALPHPNNNIPSPPAATTHSDPRYSSAGPHPHGANQYQRSYSVDSGVSRSNLSIHPGAEGQPPAPAGAPPSEPPSAPPSMEPHGPHGGAYVEHPPNGVVQHAMPIHAPHEQYSQHPQHVQPGHPHSMPPGYGHPPPQYAAPTYAQATYAQHAAGQYPLQKKKTNRAQQACTNCRTRKQKCDEQKPCGFCEKEGVKCEYKETTHPKQDRSTLEIYERLDAMHEQLAKLTEAVSSDRYGGIKRKRSSAGPRDNDDSPRLTKSPTTMSSKREDSYYEQMDDGSQLLSAVSERNPSDAQFQQAMDTATTPEQQSSSAKNVQEDDGYGIIPDKHTTGVDHLRTWPHISEFYKESGHDNVPSVTGMEEAQGYLRLFGRGQTGDVDKDSRESMQDSPTPKRLVSVTGNVESPGSDWSDPPEPDGIWGAGLPEGTYLNLDENRIRYLDDSYSRNFHIMHPFLDRKRSTQMINMFINNYKSQGASPRFPSGASPQFLGGEEYGAGDYGSNYPKPPRPIERTLSNAIVLLIMALGRIAGHTNPLPGPVSSKDSNSSSSNHPTPSSSSPSGSYRMSPASAHATKNNATQSPSMSEPRDAIMSRIDPSYPSSQRKVFRNIDQIPGLAYYACATDIIDRFATAPNLGMGNELHQIWAYLLAGLYMGQLARAMESFLWIDKACRAWFLLKKKFTDEALSPENRSETNKNVNLCRLAFWTCLQLENDIRAELDLPTSGIGKFESKIGLPNNVFDDPMAANWADVHDIYIFYSLQISLRLRLNQTHNLVYGSIKRPQLELRPAAILEGLYQLREHMTGYERPKGLKGWVDQQPTSSDINVSRVRGKFYGALYIMLRPFLHAAMLFPEHRQYRITDVNSSPSSIARLTFPDFTNDLNQQRIEITGRAWEGREYDEQVIRAAKMCIDAALNSTIVFDGLKPNRFVLTNIHGTALAQFGNMVVVSAAYLSWLGPKHANLVPREKLLSGLERTIRLMEELAPLSRVMAVNADILKVAYRKVTAQPDTNKNSGFGVAGSGPQSAHGSFGH